MSFTGIVKNELSKLNLNKLEAITELSAILKNNSLIQKNTIKIMTENSSVARHIFNLSFINSAYSKVSTINSK